MTRYTRPDDPPPQPAPRHVMRWLIVFVIIGIATPFVVSRYRYSRIAENERAVVAKLRAFADRQEAYFAANQKYAQSFSELGEDFASLPEMDERAGEDEAITAEKTADPGRQSGVRSLKRKQPPFHGYRFRVLKGKRAEGGSESFLDEQGRMTKGYAIIAAPDRYGFTGKDTFLMHGRELYAKDFDTHTTHTVQGLYYFLIPDGATKVP